jgi:hypothetical protein
MNSKQIILISIIFIALIGAGWYYYPKFKPSTPNSTNKPIETPKKTEPSKTEKETKISISQARFDEIKNYILSLDDNLLPKNLNSTEKTKIEEIRTPTKSILQRRSGKIKDKQKAIDDYNNKLNEIENKKNELKKQQQTTDIKREIRKCEIQKEKYNDMLKRAEKNKKELEQDYKDLLVSDEKITIIQLNKIYQITN